MVGVGLGAAGAASLSEFVIGGHGWRIAERCLALLALLGGAAALLVIGTLESRRAVGAAPLALPGRSFHDTLADPRLFQVALALAIGSACGLGITVHTAAMLDDRRFAPLQIATVVSLSGIGVTIGRLIGGALMDITAARLVGAGAYLSGAAAVALLGLLPTNSFAAAAASGLMLGLALGAEGDFAAFVVRRNFGMRAFSSLYGFVFSAYSLGSVVGVILCGRLYDRFGNYHLASQLGVGGFLIAASLVALLGPYRYGAAEFNHQS